MTEHSVEHLLTELDKEHILAELDKVQSILDCAKKSSNKEEYNMYMDICRHIVTNIELPSKETKSND